jgi:type I restriction enzyme S subunit
VSVHELTLDQLGTLSRGRSRHRPRDATFLYGGPVPFIQTGDVKRVGLYLTEYKQTYSEAGLAQSRLWPAGTLCITIAANIADTSILGIDACFPDSVIGFIADPEKADTRFVKYLFDAVLKMRFQSFTQGAAQDNLSQDKLLSIRFPVPNLVVQRRTADILSAYDDLIENNRRRIALLEEAARMLYREWFVRFRFPGHEHVKIIDGLPEGWERGRIEELCEFLGRGISPQYDDEGQCVVVNQKCIRGRLLSLGPSRRQSKEFKSNRLSGI